MKGTGDLGIGISGWRNKGWQGTLHPARVLERAELPGDTQRQRSTLHRPVAYTALQRSARGRGTLMHAAPRLPARHAILSKK